MSNNSDKQDNLTSKSDDGAKLLVTKTGLYALNQKELKSELKRIELEKRSYKHNQEKAQRKLISRFATKLVNSSANLENIFNNSSNGFPSSLYPPSNATSTRRSSSITSEEDFEDNSTTDSLISSFRRSKTTLTPTTPKQPSEFLAPKSGVLLNKRNSNLKASENESSTEMKSAKKKFVKWDSKVIDKEKENEKICSHLQLEREDSYYDEVKFRNNILLPQIAMARRSKTCFFDAATSTTPLPTPRRMTSGIKKPVSTEQSQASFLDSLTGEDSCFYSYKNAKGELVCDGYDNYVTLVKIASNIRKQNDESAERHRSHLRSQLSSAFGGERTHTAPQIQLRSKPSSDQQPQTHELQPQPPPSAISNKREYFPESKSRVLYLGNRRTDDDDQMCLDTFKAQNVRSLTFKQLINY